LRGVVHPAATDLKQFADAAHLPLWAAICPGNNESSGKRKSGPTHKASVWLKPALVEAAHGAARTKNRYFSSLYHRWAGRRAKKRAIVAVGHGRLVAGYYVITPGRDYAHLGANYFDERNKEMVKRQAVKRLERLAFQVELNPFCPPPYDQCYFQGRNHAFSEDLDLHADLDRTIGKEDSP
jgi:hypothetical protein